MESIIRGYEERLRIAMMKSDIEESEKLFSDDLLFVNHLGAFISKEDDLSAVKRGAVKLSEIKIISQNIRMAGDVAVVVSDVELELILNNENLVDHLIYTRIWQRFDNEWMLVGGQATKVV